MRTTQKLLPPSSSLPPLGRLSQLNEAEVNSVLQSLSDIFCPLAFQLEAQPPKNKRHVLAEPVDSGYASGVEDDFGTDKRADELAALRNDQYERSFAERWLTGFIARAESLTCFESEEQCESAMDKASCILESFYATDQLGDDGEDAVDQTYARHFSFDLSPQHSTNTTKTAIKVELNDGLAGTNSQDPDDVGLQSWGASILVSALMCESPAQFGLTQGSLCDDSASPRIIELGAGTGLISLVIARMLPHLGFKDGTVIATDYHPAVLDNLRANIAANFPKPGEVKLETSFLDWSAPCFDAPLDLPADMLVATDVVYALEHAIWLRDCAAKMLKPDGVFWLVATQRQNSHSEELKGTVEAAFSASEADTKTEPRLKILHAETLANRQGVGRGNESGYRIYRIGWA